VVVAAAAVAVEKVVAYLGEAESFRVHQSQEASLTSVQEPVCVLPYLASQVPAAAAVTC